jgi:prepilin-type N-terminal cleavage/methylation domain-containing protein
MNPEMHPMRPRSDDSSDSVRRGRRGAPRAERDRRSPASGGFTFIEMIVGLAIMALLATAVTPSLIAVLDRQRRDVALTTFSTIGGAIGAFTGDVGEYPAQLTQLTTQIGAQPDLCGVNYSVGEQGNWDGPYITRVVPTTGLPVAIGRARNQLTRFPNTLNPTHIILTVDSVVIEDALAVNKQLDDDGDDASANAVRWTTLSAADGLVTLGFWGPIQDLC